MALTQEQKVALLELIQSGQPEMAIERCVEICEGNKAYSKKYRKVLTEKAKQLIEKYDAQLCILLLLIECLVLGAVLGWKVIITFFALIVILSVVFYFSEWR